MRVIKVFLVGLIYGWFLRWIIDEIYLKDNLRMIANENMQLRNRLRLLNEPKLPAPASATSKSARRASGKDDLKKIRGIGPVMEKKLNAAGVHTYEQFSRLTTQQLQNILGISKRVQQSADNFVSQAKKLAQQKSK